MTRPVAMLQGGYYVLAGLWPLIAMESFLAVTGPKTDLWLVNTVAVLVIVIGSVLFYAGMRNQERTAPVVMLAVGSAAVLAAIEFSYSMRGEIWPVYLLDAIGELALILLWAVGVVKSGSTKRATPMRSSPPATSGLRS